MSQIASTFRRHVHVPYEQDLVDCINAYWHTKVVTTITLDTSHSAMMYGVPRIAQNQNYKHNDIVRVRRFGRNWSIVG